MRGALASYLRRQVGFQIVALLVALTAMLQVFELLDVTSDVLRRDQGWRGLVHYAALSTPSEMVLSLPLAVLLGTMTSLYALARAHEITAMRAAGLTARRLLLVLAPILVMLGLLQFALSERVLPRFDVGLKRWWNASAPADQSPTRLWARVPEGLVSIDRTSVDGRELYGLRIYRRDAQGLLVSRTVAAHAHWNDGTWQLADVGDLDLASTPATRRRVEARDWTGAMRPSDVLRLDAVKPRLSSTMLADIIAGTRVGALPVTYYRTALLRSFTAPATPLIMMLLAMPVGFVMLRGGGAGVRELLLALVLGLAFLLGDGILESLGSSGRIAPLAAALIGPGLFLVIGAWRLRACERL